MEGEASSVEGLVGFGEPSADENSTFGVVVGAVGDGRFRGVDVGGLGICVRNFLLSRDDLRHVLVLPHSKAQIE